MNAWVHIGTRLTRDGGRCGHRPDPRCPMRSRGPGRADSLAETDSGCSWPRAAGELPNESRCRRTSTDTQRVTKGERGRRRTGPAINQRQKPERDEKQDRR